MKTFGKFLIATIILTIISFWHYSEISTLENRLQKEHNFFKNTITTILIKKYSADCQWRQEIENIKGELLTADLQNALLGKKAILIEGSLTDIRKTDDKYSEMNLSLDYNANSINLFLLKFHLKLTNSLADSILEMKYLIGSEKSKLIFVVARIDSVNEKSNGKLFEQIFEPRIIYGESIDAVYFGN